MSAVPRRSNARHLANTLLNFIFPPVCANCKKVGALLCAECRAALVWLQEPLCPRCGRGVQRPVSLCLDCHRHPLPLQQIRAAVLFDGPIPRIIHQMKYNGLFALAEPLAELMIEAWARWQIPVDVVVPVPLHAERERKRGYNQSALLTNHLCRRLNLAFTPAALQRVRYTRPQVELSAAERLANVADAFKANPVAVAGADVLLIDDVCTTGATMIAATEALLAARAKTVSGYTVARAT